MATPAAIVAGAQRVSIASARLDAVGEASVAWAAPHAGRLGHADVARAAPAARGLRLGHAGVTPAARTPATRMSRRPHAAAADHKHRLRANCQTVGTAAECVVTVRVISSLRVSVALILCG